MSRMVEKLFCTCFNPEKLLSTGKDIRWRTEARLTNKHPPGKARGLGVAVGAAATAHAGKAARARGLVERPRQPLGVSGICSEFGRLPCLQRRASSESV